MQCTPQQESSQFPDKQQGLLSEYPPVHSVQLPNFVVPMNPNPVLAPPFGFAPFRTDGAPLIHGAPYEIAEPNSSPEVGSEQGSLLGFPGSAGAVNFTASYPQPWNTGPAGMPFEAPPGSQATADGFADMSDSPGKVAFYQRDDGRNPGGVPIISPPPRSTNKGMEALQHINNMDPRDGKGILAPQPMQLTLPSGQPPSHLSQLKRGKYYSGDMGRDGLCYG